MKTVRLWCSWANDTTRSRCRAATLALVAALFLPALVAGCGQQNGGVEVPPVTHDEEAAAGAALPVPAGVPGTGVTGMPTSPPVVDANASQPAPVPASTDPLPLPLPLPAPVDGAGEPDAAAVARLPADPVATPVDPTVAANVVRDYMAALGSGAFPAAEKFWAGASGDAAVLQLAHGQAFDIDVGAPARSSDARDPTSMNVPVTVRGTADDGHERRLVATYTVRALPGGEVRIVAASMRESTP